MSVGVSLIHDNNIYMGCDSYISAYSAKRTMNSATKKLFRKDKFLISFVGYIRALNILQNDFNVDTPGAEEDLDDYFLNHFVNRYKEALKRNDFYSIEDGGTHQTNNINLLVGIYNRVFAIGNDFGIIEFQENYAAIGIPFQFCLGSFFSTESWANPFERIQEALCAAANFSPHVLSPFHVITNKDD